MDNQVAKITETYDILVAEDSPVQALMIRRALDEQGFRVRLAKSGLLALEAIADQKPDILITDVEMPDMDGYALCRTVKNDPENASIPVLILTSLSATTDIICGLQSGADAYVTKPYDIPFLVERIRQLLHSDTVHEPAESLKPITVTIENIEYEINASRMQMINLLLSTYENTVRQNTRLNQLQIQLRQLNQELDKSFHETEQLLLKILPKRVALELKETGLSTPQAYEEVTVLFTDFKGFTSIAEKLTPVELIKELDHWFSYFDRVVERNNVEKLKTIGDSYMCAGGIPIPNHSHPIDVILVALEIRNFMNQVRELKMGLGLAYWQLRIGIHTGPLIAGVIGEKKFAYDVWGDTVNIASRMESSGEVDKINISQSTYNKIKDFFICTYRGKLAAKNKGEIDMYFLEKIKPEFSVDEDGSIPNEKFKALIRENFSLNRISYPSASLRR